MKTFEQFRSKFDVIPVVTAWSLADLGEARGQQELYTKQSPQKLKALREHAIIESAVSSNRIEGVEVQRERVREVVLGNSRLRDRDEEEVRGYRQALKLIHEQGRALVTDEALVLKLHHLTRAGLGDAGQYKSREGDIIEKYPDGRQRIRFKTVRVKQVQPYTRKLIDSWNVSLDQRRIPPLVALAAFNLDLLCIHPFRDGNGRVSRLLFLLGCYELGYEVGRYISLERLIEENKERYYETLKESSQGWHDARHDPWPYINYLLFILKLGYREFAQRVGQTSSPRGAKTDLIVSAVGKQRGSFSVADLQHDCPGVSLDMVRRVLKDLKAKGEVQCLGRGRNAQWQKAKKS